jgi:hypothetical protein
MTWDDVTGGVRTVTRIFPQHLATHGVLGCFPVGVLVSLAARSIGVSLSPIESCAVGVGMSLPIGWLLTRRSSGPELADKLVTLEAICDRGNMTKTEKRAYFRKIADDWMHEIRADGLREAELKLPQESSAGTGPRPSA